MHKLLQSYNLHKIKLVFHGFDLKVVESNKAIELNKYTDSSEFEDKKGVFVFTVDDTVVYVGMTNDSLKKVMIGTYGNIIPRKLHKDGQLTACRLSAFLNKNHNKKIELWFIECDDKEKIKQIKNELIDEYKPEINKR